MKRMPCFLILPFLLCSCSVTIHYMDKWEYEVHWWVVAVPLAAVYLLIRIANGKTVSRDLYVCPKCGKEFYPKWWQVGLFSFPWDGECIIKCPSCKRKGFCRRRD